MWQEEVINDLYDAGIQDNKLGLLYEINKTNNLAVKIGGDLTERVTVENIICQGDPWGSIQCSLMIDGFGKQSLHPQLEPYKYKNSVEIPLLGLVDDILSISEMGHKTVRMNSFINGKTSVKRLQFGAPKCFLMNIGKSIPKHKNIDLYVDGWKMEEVT